MNSHSFARLCLVTLLGVSVLSVQATGIHVHLCKDGQEPPALVHFEDAGIHADHHPDNQKHQDLEVSFDGGLTKTVKAAFDLSTLMDASGLLLLLPSTAAAQPMRSAVSSPPYSPRFLRPPLRGPPL